MEESNNSSVQVLQQSSADKENVSSFEPPTKKIKLSETPCDGKQKLEDRLSGILCCAVCLDLPNCCYQCTNGHLMCAGCFNHLLADARIKDETATCPNCRCEINRTICIRNLAVEKAVSELPSDCPFCSQNLPRYQLEYHQREQCQESYFFQVRTLTKTRQRWCVCDCCSQEEVFLKHFDMRAILSLTILFGKLLHSMPCSCRYSRFGCHWDGPFHEVGQHERNCIYPKKTVEEVKSAVDVADSKHVEEQKLYSDIFTLLSFEKITFNDLQLKPFRTDDFITRLYYETSKFTAFNQQWVIRANVNSSDQKNPTHAVNRSLSYQLVVKTKLTTPMSMHFLALSGPFGDIKMKSKIYNFEFTADKSETEYLELPIDSAECNKLLSSKTINFRLVMFQVTK